MAIERLPKLAISTDERFRVVLSSDPNVRKAAEAAEGDTEEMLSALARGEPSPWAKDCGAQVFTIRPMSRRETRIVEFSGVGAHPGESLLETVVQTLRFGLVDGWDGDLEDMPTDAMTELCGHISRLSRLGKAPAQS